MSAFTHPDRWPVSYNRQPTLLLPRAHYPKPYMVSELNRNLYQRQAKTHHISTIARSGEMKLPQKQKKRKEDFSPLDAYLLRYSSSDLRKLNDDKNKIAIAARTHLESKGIYKTDEEFCSAGHRGIALSLMHQQAIGTPSTLIGTTTDSQWSTGVDVMAVVAKDSFVQVQKTGLVATPVEARDATIASHIPTKQERMKAKHQQMMVSANKPIVECAVASHSTEIKQSPLTTPTTISNSALSLLPTTGNPPNGPRNQKPITHSVKTYIPESSDVPERRDDLQSSQSITKEPCATATPIRESSPGGTQIRSSPGPATPIVPQPLTLHLSNVPSASSEPEIELVHPISDHQGSHIPSTTSNQRKPFERKQGAHIMKSLYQAHITLAGRKRSPQAASGKRITLKWAPAIQQYSKVTKRATVLGHKVATMMMGRFSRGIRHPLGAVYVCRRPKIGVKSIWSKQSTNIPAQSPTPLDSMDGLEFQNATFHAPPRFPPANSMCQYLQPPLKFLPTTWVTQSQTPDGQFGFPHTIIHSGFPTQPTETPLKMEIDLPRPARYQEPTPIPPKYYTTRAPSIFNDGYLPTPPPRQAQRSNEDIDVRTEGIPQVANVAREHSGADKIEDRMETEVPSTESPLSTKQELYSETPSKAGPSTGEPVDGPLDTAKALELYMKNCTEDSFLDNLKGAGLPLISTGISERGALSASTTSSLYLGGSFGIGSNMFKFNELPPIHGVAGQVSGTSSGGAFIPDGGSTIPRTAFLFGQAGGSSASKGKGKESASAYPSNNSRSHHTQLRSHADTSSQDPSVGQSLTLPTNSSFPAPTCAFTMRSSTKTQPVDNGADLPDYEDDAADNSNGATEEGIQEKGNNGSGKLSEQERDQIWEDLLEETRQEAVGSNDTNGVQEAGDEDANNHENNDVGDGDDDDDDIDDDDDTVVGGSENEDSDDDDDNEDDDDDDDEDDDEDEDDDTDEDEDDEDSDDDEDEEIMLFDTEAEARHQAATASVARDIQRAEANVAAALEAQGDGTDHHQEIAARKAAANAEEMQRMVAQARANIERTREEGGGDEPVDGVRYVDDDAEDGPKLLPDGRRPIKAARRRNGNTVGTGDGLGDGSSAGGGSGDTGGLGDSGAMAT